MISKNRVERVSKNRDNRDKRVYEDRLNVIKKKLKEFTSEIHNISAVDKYNNNKEIYKMRRNSQILESTIKLVSRVDLSVKEKPHKKEEITDLYVKIKTDLNTLDKLLKLELTKKAREDSEEVPKIKKNLDNLKSANQELRNFDLNGAFNE